MGARPTSRAAREPFARPPKQDPPAAAVAPARPRVLSISPAAADSTGGGVGGAMGDPAPAAASTRVEPAAIDRAIRDFDERLRLGARMLKAFQVQIDSVDGALDRAREHEERLEDLLRQLAPWERLILHADRTGDGTPKPVAGPALNPALNMVERLRSGILRDVAELSAAMRSLTDRVDEMSVLARAPAAADGSMRFRDHAETA